MKCRVLASSRLWRDVDDAMGYVGLFLKNPKAARELLRAVDSALSALSEFPERHPLANDAALAALGIRFADVKRYFLFYWVDRNASEVIALRFLHAKSDWASILRRDIPKDGTIAAFREIEDGSGHHFSGTTEELFDELPGH